MLYGTICEVLLLFCVSTWYVYLHVNYKIKFVARVFCLACTKGSLVFGGIETKAQMPQCSYIVIYSQPAYGKLFNNLHWPWAGFNFRVFRKTRSSPICVCLIYTQISVYINIISYFYVPKNVSSAQQISASP